MSMLEHALDYAARGWYVHPLKPNGKTPITAHGFKDATTDPDQIRAWWQKHPKANIGIATGASGLVVLDGDVKNGENPDASLARLLNGHHSLPQTLRAETPSGGWHLFFSAIPDVDIFNSAGELGPGLDVRGIGGYAVAAPSVVDGKPYKWTSDVAPALFPECLREAPAKNPVKTDITGLKQGARNDGVYRYACALRAVGTDDDDAQRLVLEKASQCDPPFGKAEALVCLKSAWKHPAGKPMMTASISNVSGALKDTDFCGVEIRHDEFRDCIMLSIPGKNEWREATDADMVRLRIILEGRGFKSIGRELIRDAVGLVADEKRFDTAKHWLNGLHWDGVARVDGFLTRYFSAADTPYIRAVSRYLWTAMAGRVLEPGCKADMVPILIGEQGVKKSSGIAELVPHPDQFCEISFHEKDNDLSRRMRGTLVAELAELQGLRSRELEFIKAFITRRFEKWTPKYKEFDVTFPRRLVFIGTTNAYEFLDDETGNRRWLPVSVGEVDVDGIRAMREQLWAEARELFNASGVAYKEAEALAPDIHAEHTITDEWATVIQQWLGTRARSGNEEVITVGELMASVLDLPTERMSRAYQMRVAKILRTLGFKGQQRTVDGRNTRVWVRVGHIHPKEAF